MAIAFDAVSTLNVFTGTASWTHTPSGTPAGALVLIIQRGSSADQVTGVTWGATNPMSEVVLPYQDTVGGAVAYGYFLSAPPAGAQTVEVTCSSTAGKRAISYTVTATTGLTEVVDVDGIGAGGTDDPSVTLSTGADNAFVAAASHFSLAALTDITPDATHTSVAERDDGTDVLEFTRRTSIGAGSLTAGWTTSAASGVALIAVAIKEASAVVGGAMLDPIGMRGFFGG